jgi:hypothetical protein
MENPMRTRSLIPLLLAVSSALPAWSQTLPSASMLGPAAGKVPSYLALKWVYVIDVESVDEAAIDQVRKLLLLNGFRIEQSRTERAEQPAMWRIAGRQEYAARTTKPDLILAEMKKAIAADTAKFTWTMTPTLVPKKG